MSLGDDQATFRALALEYRIRTGRGAMVDVIKFAVPTILLLQYSARLDDTFLDTNGLIGRVRGHFRAYRFAVGGDDTNVREGTVCLSASSSSCCCDAYGMQFVPSRMGTKQHRDAWRVYLPTNINTKPVSRHDEGVVSGVIDWQPKLDDLSQNGHGLL